MILFPVNPNNFSFILLVLLISCIFEFKLGWSQQCENPLYRFFLLLHLGFNHKISPSNFFWPTSFPNFLLLNFVCIHAFTTILFKCHVIKERWYTKNSLSLNGGGAHFALTWHLTCMFLPQKLTELEHFLQISQIFNIKSLSTDQKCLKLSHGYHECT